MKKKRTRSGGGSRNVADEGTKILFVGALNQNRGPTAEKTWNRRAGFSARSAGISPFIKKTLTPKDIHWADYIIAMEEKHKNRIVADFSRALKDKTVQVLGISDQFKYMDPDLIKQLEKQVAVIVKA